MVLKKRFEDAKFDGWQGYGFLGFPKPGEDPRQHCFDKMTASVDALPEDWAARAEKLLAFHAIWFEHEMGNLCEDVGWEFFPNNAADFVVRLVIELEGKPLPNRSELRRLERGKAYKPEPVVFGDA